MRAFSDSEKEIIKARLLEAAYRLFSKQGFFRTNVAQLARAAGIGKGTFYIFFNSKEELLWALHQKMHGDFDTRLRPLLADLARNPEDAIRRFLQTAFEMFADPL